MKYIKKLYALIPRYAHLPLILTFVSMMTVYNLPRILNVAPTFDFVLPIDGKIPLISFFSYIYIIAYVYWALSYIYISRFSKDFCTRLFTADLIGKIVSFACFMLLPCTFLRPAAEEAAGIGAWLIKVIYTMDEPTNLLPSLHCFVSYLCVRPLFSKNAPKTNLAMLIVSVVYSALVCLSTLFTRQHIFLDLVTGIALGEIAWMIAKFVPFRKNSKE